MFDENYNFTYEIKSLNIENGYMEIEYIPENDFLTPVTMNINLLEKPVRDILHANNTQIYKTQEEVPFQIHLDHTIEASMPILKWRNQLWMLNNIEAIENSTGKFEVDLKQSSIKFPSGFVTIL